MIIVLLPDMGKCGIAHGGEPSARVIRNIEYTAPVRVRASLFLVCLLIATGASAGWSEPVAVAPDASQAPVPLGHAVAGTDGDTYLIVTEDDRGMRALRADAAGQIVNLESIPIAPALRRWPWTEGPYGIAGNGSEWLISLRSSIRVLHSDGRVANVATTLTEASVVSNGRNFLAWSRGPRAEIVSPEGAARAIDRAALPDTLTVAAANGEVYAVAGFAANAIVVNVIDGEGRARFAGPKKIVDVPLAAARRVWSLGIARVHGNFRLLWLERDSGDAPLAWTIASADFTPEGVLVAPPRVVAEGVDLSPGYSPGGSLFVTQAGPADAIVRWTFDSYRYQQTTFGCGAAFPSRTGSFASNGRTVVHAAYEGPPVVAVTMRSAPFACDPATLGAAPAQIPSWAAGDQAGFLLAAGRHDVLASWSERGVRHARLISHAGQPLRWMQLPEETGAAGVLRVDTDGTGYVAVWLPDDRRSIRFARVVADGEPPAPVVTLATFEGPASGLNVEWDGTAYVVAWTGYGDSSTDLFGMRVSRDGAVIAGPTVILPYDAGVVRYDVALARRGRDLLAAWSDRGVNPSGGLPCGGCQNPRGVRALRIGADLRPIGTVAALSGQHFELHGLFGNDDAWYVLSQDWQSLENQVSRIDGDGTVRTIDAVAGDISGVPLGGAGFGTLTARGFAPFDDFAQRLFDWPHDAEDPRELTFVRAGRHVLALFAARADRLPYNGAHRAFVTALPLESGIRRRPARH